MREEKLHTAVLAHQLEGTDGVRMAQRLIDRCLPEFAKGPAWTVAKVEAVDPERAMPCRSPDAKGRTHRGRRADLGVTLAMSNGEERQLIVECKVDSAVTREQLDDMSWRHDFVVLLALGSAAFAKTQEDLDVDADAGYVRDDPFKAPLSPVPARRATDAEGAAAIEPRRSWTLVDPAAWLDILSAGAAPARGTTLADYHAVVRAEKDRHDAAAIIARAAGPTAAGGATGRLQTLTAAARGAELRRELYRCPPPAGTHWNATQNADQNGPRMMIWPHDWSTPDVTVYLQIDLTRQTLAVRAGMDRKLARRDAFRSALQHAISVALDQPEAGDLTEGQTEADLEVGSHIRPWKHKTSTLTTLSLAGRTPAEAAARIVDVVAQVHNSVVNLRDTLYGAH